jgi:dihydroneopterin aldolase
MTDTVVSVRMPSTLVRELRILADKNHYMDLSEEIRSVVRSKCFSFTEPVTSKIAKLKQEQTNQQMIEELKKLIGRLENEK